MGTRSTNFLNALKSDQILDFYDLNSNFQFKVSNYLNSWKVDQELPHVLFYKLDVLDCPTITVSIKITEFLEVEVFVRSKKVEDSYIESFVGSDCILKYWKQLENLLNFFGSDTVPSPKHNADFYISEAFSNLYECLENLSVEDEVKNLKGKLKFLTNQIGLLKRNVYSSYTIQMAYSIYLCSSSCYKEIENLGCLTIPTENELLRLINQTKAKLKH
ncbi:unnamed protein product [Larinioides sclopetarius]|uniref:Uncharacterized protein n=1 Tax=Larinioides sclopetarius TaxID=280406 RepID=A0AAV2AKA3_9ARAC